MSDVDHNLEVQAPSAAAPRYVPVMPAKRPAPRVAAFEPVRANPLLRALAKGTTALRRTISIASLSVPFAYLLAFFVGGGLLNAQLDTGVVGGFVHSIVTPGLWLCDQILAKRIVDHGWNFELLFLGALLFIPRHFLLLPFERLDRWAADLRTRSAYGAAMVAVHPGAAFMPKPVARQTLPPNSALGKA